MYMGFDDTSDCYTSKLGVGINAIRSKMGVFNETERDQVSVGLQVTTENLDPSWDSSLSSGGIVGIVTSAQGVHGGINHVGLEATAFRGKLAIGIVAGGIEGMDQPQHPALTTTRSTPIRNC
jgi:hypothetical protein